MNDAEFILFLLELLTYYSIVSFPYSWINFAGSGQALTAMARCLTGEDWYQLMWDVAVSLRLVYCEFLLLTVEGALWDE